MVEKCVVFLGLCRFQNVSHGTMPLNLSLNSTEIMGHAHGFPCSFTKSLGTKQ